MKLRLRYDNIGQDGEAMKLWGFWACTAFILLVISVGSVTAGSCGDSNTVSGCVEPNKQTVEEAFKLGIDYSTGASGVQDSRLAVQWMRRAASQGHLYAQFNLGEALINGYGVTQDYQEGIVWLKRAANGGVADAQVSLGLKYDEGIGVTQNYQMAVKWYLAAARQGNQNGQNNLAVAYAMGQGVTKDYVAAFAWFELARLAGHPSSGEYRDQVSINMTPEQLAEAQRLLIQLGGE